MIQLFLDNISCSIFFSLFVLYLFILASYGAGHLFSHYILKISFRQILTEAIIDLALGFNLLALITLSMGSLKILNPTSIWILLSLVASVGVWLRIVPLLKAKLNFLS